MWTCEKCGERIEDQFEACWRCDTPKGAAASAAGAEAAEANKPWRLAFQVFRGTWISWQNLFAQAAQWATEIGPERVVGISHSSDSNDGIVTVWYWTQEP
jgi:hypothetical protein